MVTRRQIHDAIRECLDRCQWSDAQYACLSEYIAELKQERGWSPVDAAQVENKAVRLLAVLKEPVPARGD